MKESKFFGLVHRNCIDSIAVIIYLFYHELIELWLYVYRNRFIGGKNNIYVSECILFRIPFFIVLFGTDLLGNLNFDCSYVNTGSFFLFILVIVYVPIGLIGFFPFRLCIKLCNYTMLCKHHSSNDFCLFHWDSIIHLFGNIFFLFHFPFPLFIDDRNVVEEVEGVWLLSTSSG